MKNFEKNLARLEELTEKIKSKDISLEEALSSLKKELLLPKEWKKKSTRLKAKSRFL